MRSYFCLPALIAAAGASYAAVAPLSLKIGNEIQPPAGTVQMKLFLTEPKPISTGRGRMAISAAVASGVEAVNLFSTAGDAAGAAVLNGTHVQLVCIVPSAVLGSDPDFPLLTITGTVRGDAAIGSSIPLNINPANLVLLDQNGVPYTEEIHSGLLSIADNVSITGINPGSATVPAGGTFIISGLNFTPATTVTMKEVKISSVTYVSPTELDVTVKAPVTMQGQKVTVQNQDGTSAIFYSYQQTAAAGRSSSALFAATYPIFENMFWTMAAFLLPADAGATYSGLAVQNLQAANATVKVSLIASNGSVLGQRAFQLTPNSRLVRKMAEFVSTPPPAGSYWRVQSSLPVQMLGLNGDDSTGVVTPILPASTR